MKLASYISWIILICLVLTVTTSCGTAKPKAKEVHVDEPAPPLEMPPDLFRPKLDAALGIPKLSGSQKAQQFLLQSGQVRLEREGSMRWLVIKAEPDVLWRQMQKFWKKRGYNIKWQNITLGIMETVWRVDETTGIKKNSTKIILQRNKYRVRIEPGKERGTTDVYITQRTQFQTSQGKDIVWQTQPPDPELEIEMLHRILVYLGVNKTAAKRLLNPAYEPWTYVRVDKKNSRLVLAPAPTLSLAWRKLGLALDRVGYVIGKRTLAEVAFEFNTGAKKKTKSLRLVLERHAKNIWVILVGVNGKKLAEDDAKPILTAIKDNMI